MITSYRQRLLPHFYFPEYAHVPGLTVHPKKKGGHSEFIDDPEPEVLNPSKPYSSDEFLHAVDLFNYGYYWESHVWWEGLWHACGRRGVMADFLKALIKLGAAGVKAKVKEEKGVIIHSQRAQELFDSLLKRDVSYYAGFDIADLFNYSQDIEMNAVRYCEKSTPNTSVFDRFLIPDKR